MLPVCPLVHTHKWIGMYSIVNKVKITMEQSDDEFGLFGVAEKIERMKYQAAKGAGSTKDWPLKLFFFFYGYFSACRKLEWGWTDKINHLDQMMPGNTRVENTIGRDVEAKGCSGSSLLKKKKKVAGSQR